MTKRKYFSWTDEKRAELKEFINTHDKKLPEAMKEAAVLFGVSIGSCYGAYRYEPQRPIVTEVDPSDLEPREGRTVKRKAKGKLMTIGQLIKEVEAENTEMQMKTPEQTVVEEKPVEQKKLKVSIHNDRFGSCLIIDVNDSVTVIKIGDVIVTLEV
jgi:hypothetical protein